jgi:hypothetical protein
LRPGPDRCERAGIGRQRKEQVMNGGKRIGAGAAIAAALALAAVAPAAAAPAKDGDVRVAGRCTGATTSKLKLSREDGMLEVEFEVDQNRVGVRWAVVIRRNGVIVARRSMLTHAPSGSFEARVVTGGGRITATATRRGETCRAAASL